MAVPKVTKDVLLFEDEDAEGESSDPQLEQKINKYLEERTSRAASRKDVQKPGKDGAEEHTGITDDEADEEGEPDYDVASRMTLKATSEAFLEVMAEARMQHEKEKEAAGKGQGKAASGSKKA